MPKDHIQLEDNLLLRPATVDDVDKVAKFNETVMADPPEMRPEPSIGEWTRDLFEGVNSNVGPSDFTVVEDIETNEIVSSIVLMSQVWNIGGIETPMGMPEIVGTHPDYRRRGLIRRQFSMMHEWSNQRGHIFNTVMGIPFYYKQFGYEYALDAWSGKTTSPALVGKVLPKESDRPPFSVREADREDLSFIAETNRTAESRLFVTAKRDVDTFEREMFDRRPGSATYYRIRIFERDGEPVGFYSYHLPGELGKHSSVRIDSFEISSVANWFDATVSMLVDLNELATALESESQKPFEKFEFGFGSSHPAFDMFDQQFGADKSSYAWVIRVPDVAALVSHLSPAIENRLANSALRGWSGDVKLSFYRSGLALKLENGRLKSVENTGPIERHEADALYPDLTFTKALFGQYSFTQLREMYSDCFAHKRVHHTLQDILWGGQQPSAVLPTN